METSLTSSLAGIQQLLKQEFEQVNNLIQSNLLSDIELIQTINHHLVESGGKRLRPLLTLLAGRTISRDNPLPITLAVIVEFLHTATLLHDDVVDGSNLRRGRQTAHTLWGNAASILVGDFLYSRAFQLMSDLKSLEIYTLLANATHVIAEGEVLQLIHRQDKETTQAQYLEVIRCKTATLFSAAGECGVVVAGGDPATQKALASYGLHIGMAFQMIDDWLDYAVSAKESGKNRGDDLAEGKITLPIICALQTATLAQKNCIQAAFKTGDTQALDPLLEILNVLQIEEKIQQLAQIEINAAKTAIQILPNNPYKQALIQLADFAIERRY